MSSPSKASAIAGVQLQVANELSATPQPVTDTDGSQSGLQLSTSNTIISPGTKLGVANASPQYPLHVGMNSTVRFELGQQSMLSLGGQGVFNIDAVNVPAGRFTVANNGNVGINRVSPQSTLDVNGTVSATNLNFTGQLSVPGMKGESTAPPTANLQLVFIDTTTGILYYHD